MENNYAWYILESTRINLVQTLEEAGLEQSDAKFIRQRLDQILDAQALIETLMKEQ